MNMRFPALFINHGGGPLPLLGQQPGIVSQLQLLVSSNKYIPTKPDAIVVVSAHYEANPIQITSGLQPNMIYDYYGFPKESYKFQYNAPGSPKVAQAIQSLLTKNSIPCQLNPTRGYDHGVYVPLMIMYPDANIPVVVVSLHTSLSAQYHIEIGKALAPLRDQNILLLGSGYTYHNMEGVFHPSPKTYTASTKFNDWLKEVLLSTTLSYDERMKLLQSWESKTAPYGRLCHPREEHLLPLLVIAGTATTTSDTTYPTTGPNNINDSDDNDTKECVVTLTSDNKQQQGISKTELFYSETSGDGQHAISSYIFY